uniref:Uncharacterized protein n=1 Tax=Arundo donax TaxID=35708 RepID=A0A0A9GJN9_ARUDO
MFFFKTKQLEMVLMPFLALFMAHISFCVSTFSMPWVLKI